MRLGLGVENFSKIEVKVRVAKLKKIVVDVGVGVAISKKIGLWLGLGMFWATKLWCCCDCGWYKICIKLWLMLEVLFSDKIVL